MCFVTSNGREIHNRVRDFFPHKQPGTPSKRQQGHLLKKEKPLEVFQDNKSIFGHLVGRDRGSDKMLFRPAGADDPILIDGDLPATKTTNKRITTAAEAVAA